MLVVRVWFKLWFDPSLNAFCIELPNCAGFLGLMSVCGWPQGEASDFWRHAYKLEWTQGQSLHRVVLALFY